MKTLREFVERFRYDNPGAWVYWDHPLPDPPGRTLPILVAIIAPGEPLPPNDTREANAFDGKDDGPCLDLRLAWDISQLPPRAFVRRP